MPKKQIDAATLKRQQDALQLRCAGVPLDTIATELGYADKSGAWRAIQAVLERREVASTEEYRRIENERLDRLLRAVWASALDGNLGAVDRALRICERRARLNGLDMSREDATVTDILGDLDAQIRELLS